MQTKSETAAEIKRTDGKLRLLFATEAYSMGTDVEDIRRVIHFGPPSSIEGFLMPKLSSLTQTIDAYAFLS